MRHVLKAEPALEGLSILTAPEGAVQYTPRRKHLLRLTFQSSPPPKERCNFAPSGMPSLMSSAFNPHRPRRSGAIIPGPQRALYILNFQSSPPPKERCNKRKAKEREISNIFQSSPPPKERCNG